MSFRPLALLIAAAGLAMPVAFAAPPATTPPSDAPALGGPKVNDHAVPGSPGASFGSGNPDKGKDRVREIPHQMWMYALNESVGENAPAAVRTTPEQREQIMALNQAFMKAQGDFMVEHKEELQQLRRKTGEYGPGGPGGPNRPGGGKRPDGADAPPPPPPMDGEPMTEVTAQQREQAMVRLRDLREAGPQPVDTQKKIFALLTPDQQKAFEARLVTAKEQMNQREMQNRLPLEAKRVREKLGGPPGEVPQKFGGQAPKKNPERNAAGGVDISPEQRDRVMALLARLTPEQREQLLNRLEQRMADEAAGTAPTPPPGDQPPAGKVKKRTRNDGKNVPPQPPPPPAGN